MLQYAHKYCAILSVCWHRVRISYFAGDVVHAIFAYAMAANLLVACGGSQHRGLMKGIYVTRCPCGYTRRY